VLTYPAFADFHAVIGVVFHEGVHRHFLFRRYIRVVHVGVQQYDAEG
jgi:hypothetical protein